MSSGEKAKSPATFEERNPFDISRHSHTEVAGEIAKRMAAWKQARGRSYAAPATAPAGAEKRPQVSAPVQPALAPKHGERPAAEQVSASESQARPAETATRQQPASSNASGRARVPYFATFSLQRAMPPAPSPRKPDASAQKPISSAQPSQAAAMPTATDHEIAPADEGVTEMGATTDVTAVNVEAKRLDAEAAAWPPAEMLLADSGSGTVEPAAAEASAPAPGLAEGHSVEEDVHPVPARDIGDIRAEAPAVTETEPAAAAEAAKDIEDRRAQARNMRARWIAAHDLDSPHLEESSAVERAAPTTSRSEASADEAVASEDARPNAPEIAAVTPPTDVSDDAPGRMEPTLDAPMERPDLAEPTGAEPAAPPSAQAFSADRPEIAAAMAPDPLVEIEGLNEPILEPIERSNPGASSAAATQSNEASGADGPEMPAAISREALVDLSGRKEPTFETPVADSTEPNGPGPATARTVDEAPKAAIPFEALDALSGRKEPTFDEPAARQRKSKEAAIPAPAGLLKGESGIKLRAIETRIEARRIETLRTDSQMAVGPDIPHLERDEWDVPTPVSNSRAAERHGWAIGLGAALLIVGITAPAAIWQHDRQVSPPNQDQVALDPALLPPQQKDTQQKDAQQKDGGSTPAPAPKTASANPAAPVTPATLPPPETAGPRAPAASAPQVTDAPAVTPPAPVALPQTNEAAAQPQQDPPEQTTLGAVQDGGQLDKVPVSTPRLTPKTQAKPQAAPVHLASRAPMPFATASSQPSGSLMLAKPFVPEPGSDNFLRAPTTGIATVPIDSGSGAHGASVVVRPTLMAQLKPKPAGAKPFKGAAQISAPKPADQSLDQMFQTLVDTLSEGKPANPATKPLPPSNRR